MGSTFVYNPNNETSSLFNEEADDKHWLQFVPGIVVQVITNRNTPGYNDETDINSIIAKSHANTVDNIQFSAMANTRYYPLLRGMVDVPVNGDPVRAIDLDDSLDITDTIISKVDLTPIALKAASKGVNEARKSQLFSEREVIRALRTKLNDMSIKEEHKKSISIDHAFNVSNNPIEDLKTDIVTVIGSSLKNNKYKSTTELINATYLYHKDILNTVKERM